MKRLITFLACLIGFTASAQYRPNYFDTNSNPFNVVPGVSIYVPTLYSTNILTTNLSVTDFLFIGTAQINYLTMLGSINQQGVAFTNYFMADTNSFDGDISANKFFGDGTGLTNLSVAASNVYSGGLVPSASLGTNGGANNVLFWNGPVAYWAPSTNLSGTATNIINVAAGTLVSIVTNSSTLVTISADSQTNAAGILAIASPLTNAANILAITAQQTNATEILAITAQQTNTAALETDLQITARTNASSIIEIASPLTNGFITEADVPIPTLDQVTAAGNSTTNNIITSGTNIAAFFSTTNDTFTVDGNGAVTAANFQVLVGGDYVTANGTFLMEQPNVFLTGFQTNTCAENIPLTAYPNVYAAQSQIDAFPEGPHTPGFMSFSSCAGSGFLIYKTNSHWVMVDRGAGGSGCAINCVIATNDNPDIKTGWYEVAGGDPLTFNTSPAYIFAAGELGSIGNITALGTNSASEIVSSGLIIATNGYYQQNYSLNQAISVFTNKQLYCVNGTNQVVTLIRAAENPWVIYRFVSTNGNGNFTITNSSLDNATLRDGASHTMKQIGVGEVGLFSDGASWQLASKFKTVWPNAQFSCTTNISLSTTARAISFNTTDFNNSQGIALLVGTNATLGHTTIAITNLGQYEFSPSLIESFGGNNTVTFWFKQNGTNIPNSATVAKGQNNTLRVITVPFVVNVSEVTLYEIWAISDASGQSLAFQAAGGSPPNDFPLSPSIICPIKRISDSRP